MKCPSCKQSTTIQNTKSRLNFTRRDRICGSCGLQFSTVEIKHSYYKRLRYGIKQKIQKIMRKIEEVCEI